MSATLKTIPGYSLTTLICEAGDLLLYRATRTLDGQDVLVKVPADSRPEPVLLHRLEHEYDLARDLDSGRIARPLDLVRYTGTMALILEQGPDRTLASMLGSPLDIRTFLKIAIGITAALTELHRHELVHKDIKPEHVLLDAEGHVWLTGLGIASRLPREHQTPEPPEVIAGTLAYMAPEQTGRMNRSIDSRSDFYSLGITFYQMLTGVLPFSASEPMEWVHCHIARQSVPPNQQVIGLPEPLSEMVMKLMAKTAEERYQSSASLDADLRLCLTQWESNGRMDPFLLGAQDAPERLLIPEKLYGRQSEIDALLAAFERVASSGTSEVVLVSGYPGVGKTSVINELHKVLVPLHGLFAAGKFDQYKRDIPYATLVQAIQTLIRHILCKSEPEVAAWREALQQAVGQNGQLVVSLIPEVELVIGKQPPVPDLPPQEALNRFQMVLRRFIRGFSGPDHPLVIFFDDLQWLDTATLELLNKIAMGLEGNYILLIGAYRDNEVGPAHPLMRIIDTMRKVGTRVQEIVLAPLTVDDVGELIADSLRCERARAFPLAQLVHEKSGGNPFFVIQFLSALAEEKLLAFDPGVGLWNWDLAQIRAKGFTDNVVDLMLGKLNRLQAKTRESLKQLACLGRKSSVVTLGQVQEIAAQEVEENLREAIRAGFLFRQDDSVSFLHDRIQEAAYALIPEAKRAEVHLHIGRTLLSQTGPEEQGDILFEIANHLNRGAGLMTDPAEKARLAELNAAAGRRARASVAYATARDFFAAAAALLPEGAWEDRYDFLFALYLDWAEAEYLQGAFAAAERLFAILLARAKSDLDKAAVYELRLTVYPIAGKYNEALAMGIMALRLFGEEIPEDDEALNRVIQAEAAALKTNLRGRKIAELAGAPEATDLRIKTVTSLLTRMGGPAYISRPPLFPLTAFKSLNYALKYGMTKEASHAFSGYAHMLVSSFDDPHSGYAFSQAALSLSERFGDLRIIGSGLYMHGNHINFWINPIATDFPILERGFRVCLDAGNLVFANYIAYSIVWQAVERGDALCDALDYSGKYADFALGSRNEAIYQTIILEQQFLKCLMGETDGDVSFSDAGINELACVEKIGKASFICGVMYYHTMKTMAAYLMGDDAVARTHAEEAGKILAAVMGQPMEAMFYFLHALVLTRACREAEEKNREEILKTLATYQKKLAFWAGNCPANFAGKHALVAAEIAEIEGNELSAERLFEQAIESARTNGFIHWEAMANEAAARFHGNRGLKTVSSAYLREAHACYARWGARRKEQQMEQRYPQLREVPSPARSSTGARDIDIHAITLASQAISGEIILDNLLKTLMRIVLENAGARQGYLLLNRKDVLTLAAIARVEKQNVVMYVHGEPGFAEDALPASILNYVRRSREPVLLDDATAPNPYSADEYFLRQHPKSVLCFPITKQTRLIGVLYLENDLATHAFTPDRMAVLKLLATQTAISLENALVYEALRASELRYRMSQEMGHVGNWEYNIRTSRFWGSDEAKRIYGFDPAQSDFSTEEVETCIPERERVHQALVDLIEKGKPYNLEFEIHPRDSSGSRIIASIADVQRDEYGNPQAILGVIHDITGRKRAEAALAESEQQFRRLAENSPDNVVRYDRQCRAIYYNPVMLRTLGVDPGRILGLTPLELGAGGAETDTEYERHIRQVLQSGESCDMELTLQLPGGKISNHLIRFAPERDTQGGVDGVLAIGRDVTEIKRAEEEIRKLNQGLEQRVAERTAQLEFANQELEAFSYSVSHDLRTPLRAVDGFSKILLDSYIDKLDEEGKRLLNVVRDNTGRMGQLIDDMLKFSRTGRIELTFSDIDMEKMARDVFRELRPAAVDSKLQLEIGPLPPAKGDSAMMRQVFVNLLSNAIKFSRAKETPAIRVGATVKGAETIYYVQDNGVGFSMQYADKLFGVFQRLHGINEFEGTGIGLAIVKRIVIRHGGRVWAESKVNEGATIYFALPNREKNHE